MLRLRELTYQGLQESSNLPKSLFWVALTVLSAFQVSQYLVLIVGECGPGNLSGLAMTRATYPNTSYASIDIKLHAAANSHLMIPRKGLTPLRFLRHESTRHRQAAVSVMPSPFMTPVLPGKEPSQANFLRKLSTRDLTLYTMLSTVTASPILLKSAIWALPYTPNFLIKRLVYPIYCGGETFEEVVATAQKLQDRGIGNMMLSYSVEDANGTSTSSKLDQSVATINQSIKSIVVKHSQAAASRFANGETITPPASGYVALKPTGLMANSAQILANYNQPEYASQWEAYLDVCRSICRNAAVNGEGKAVIVFDAEKMWLQRGVYAAQRQMMKEFNRNGQIVVCGTVQMYLQHSFDLLKEEIELAKEGNYQIAMKLVRGAYIHSEPNRWQDIHVSKADADKSYDAGTSLMMDHIVQGWNDPSAPSPVGRLIVASHNLESCDIVDHRMKRDAPLGFDMLRDESVVFGQLLGMNDAQSCDLADRGRKIVKYVPWGPVQDTKEYLSRRLEENGDSARGGWSDVLSGLSELARRLKLA